MKYLSLYKNIKIFSRIIMLSLIFTNIKKLINSLENQDKEKVARKKRKVW